MAIPPLSTWLTAMPFGSVAGAGPLDWRPALGCGLGWLLWSVLVGYLGHRLPASALDHDSWWSRPRPWGEPLASYGKRLAIRRWKAWLPDAGALFPGGVVKGDLVGRDRSRLQRLVVETRRAEFVHWVLLPGGCLTVFWLPTAGVLMNLAFALVLNLPCLLLQRHNRARLQHCLAWLEPAQDQVSQPRRRQATPEPRPVQDHPHGEPPPTSDVHPPAQRHRGLAQSRPGDATPS